MELPEFSPRAHAWVMTTQNEQPPVRPSFPLKASPSPQRWPPSSFLIWRSDFFQNADRLLEENRLYSLTGEKEALPQGHEDFSCFLLVLWLCHLHVGVHPSHFNSPYAVRPDKAPSLAQPGAKPRDSAWPLFSAGPGLCPVFLSWNCWKLWDDFSDFLRLIFSLHSSYIPNSGNDVKRNQLCVWGPLCPMCPQAFSGFSVPRLPALLGPEWGGGGGPGKSGCWSQLCALRVYTVQSQPLQFSLLPQLPAAFRGCLHLIRPFLLYWTEVLVCYKLPLQ